MMEPIKDESIQVEITVPDKDDQELLIKALRTGEPIVATINRGTEHEFSVLVTIDSAEPV